MNTFPRVLSLMVSTVFGRPESLLVQGAAESCRILVANTPPLKREAARLVQQVYENKGYSATQKASEAGCNDAYDGNPETTTLLVEYGDRFVATLRVIPDSPIGLPMDAVYPERLDELRRTGRRPCEIASMAFLETEVDCAREVLFLLFRVAYLVARRVVGATDFVGSVMTHHRAFYKRVLLFDEVDSASRIGPKSGCPVTFVRLNLETAEARYEQHYATREGRKNLFEFFCSARSSEDITAWVKAVRPAVEEEDWPRAEAPRMVSGTEFLMACPA